MLTKGIRDQKKVKSDTMLSTLLSLVFVPKFWNTEDTNLVDNQLMGFDLTTATLDQIEEGDLIKLLEKHQLDWTQREQFADFLVGYTVDNTLNFSAKAMAIYNHIQMDSKIFSFGINTKIATIQSKS